MANAVINKFMDSKKIIYENSDLNDIKDAGEYICMYSTEAKTLVNCPTSIAFYMVIYEIVTDYCFQEIKSLDGCKYYRRDFCDGKWTDWKSV
jgi:hypothetical protein